MTHPRRANRARHCRWRLALPFWLSYTIALIWARFYNKCRNYKPSRSNVPAVWTEREAETATLPRSLASGLSIRCWVGWEKEKQHWEREESGQQLKFQAAKSDSRREEEPIKIKNVLNKPRLNIIDSVLGEIWVTEELLHILSHEQISLVGRQGELCGRKVFLQRTKRDECECVWGVLWNITKSSSLTRLVGSSLEHTELFSHSTQSRRREREGNSSKS